MRPGRRVLHEDRDLYPSLGLSRGVFFSREAFGVDRLVTGDPMRMVADDIPSDRMNERPSAEFIADFPVSDATKAAPDRAVHLVARPARGPHGGAEARPPASDELPRLHQGALIANSDSGWMPFAHAAIDQAHRAVGELLDDAPAP